jgi:hypothetical protein
MNLFNYILILIIINNKVIGLNILQKKYLWILPINYSKSQILLKYLIESYFINLNSPKIDKLNKNKYISFYENSFNFYKNINNYSKIVEKKNAMINYVCGLSSNYNPQLFICGYNYQENNKYYYIILDILILKSSEISNSKIKSTNLQIEINHKNSINLFWDLYIHILQNENIDYIDLTYYKKLIKYKSQLNILDIFINETENFI